MDLLPSPEKRQHMPMPGAWGWSGSSHTNGQSSNTETRTAKATCEGHRLLAPKTRVVKCLSGVQWKPHAPFWGEAWE